MDLTEFRASVAGEMPPATLSDVLQSLWWDAKGDWDKAHDCAQRDETQTGSSVHAYLHRKEGDLRNAGYWYNRAGRPPSTATLDEEWEMLARGLLAR